MSGHIRASLCFSTWMIPNDILIVKNGQCSGANLASKSSNIPKTKSSPGSCVRVEVPRILQSTPVNGPCFRSEAGPSVSSLHFLGVGSPIAPSMPSSMTGREILPTSVFFPFYPTHTVYEGDVCFCPVALSHFILLPTQIARSFHHRANQSIHQSLSLAGNFPARKLTFSFIT